MLHSPWPQLLAHNVVLMKHGRIDVDVVMDADRPMTPTAGSNEAQSPVFLQIIEMPYFAIA